MSRADEAPSGESKHSSETPGRPERVTMARGMSGEEFKKLKDNEEVSWVADRTDGFAPGIRMGQVLWILNRDSTEREGLLAIVTKAEDTPAGRKITIGKV